MSQQVEDPSNFTRTLVVKPALSQMYDQLLPTSKSLKTACKNHCTHASVPRHVSVSNLDPGISQTVLVARLAHSAGLRSRLCHVSSAPSVAYSTGVFRLQLVTHPVTLTLKEVYLLLNSSDGSGRFMFVAKKLSFDGHVCLSTRPVDPVDVNGETLRTFVGTQVSAWAQRTEYWRQENYGEVLWVRSLL